MIRMARAARLPLVAAVVVGAVVPAVQAAAPQQAARALRLDPGARVGGNTQVAAADGQRLLGVPSRPNFMVGFGRRERVVGGVGSDQLGSRGTGNEVDGRGGNDLLHGGRGDVLDGGPGDDLIVASGGGAMIRTGPGRDKVITSGRGNLIDCAAGSRDALIYASHGDTIASSCRAHGSRVLYRAPADPAHAAQAATQPVSGDGSNDHPFTAQCDDPSQYPDCTVNSFAARTLAHFWSNEYVPAYLCPAFDHPYLLNQDYAPFGTTLQRGVEVSGLGPVGVEILGGSYETGRDGTLYFTGTLTGAGNSSATNWDGRNSSYRVVLHCTADRSRANQSQG